MKEPIKELLMVVGAPEAANGYTEMIRNTGISVRVVCHPKGLPGLLAALRGPFANTQSMVISGDAFARFKVELREVVQSIRKEKPSMQILVFRTGCMEKISVAGIIDAGANDIYSHECFSNWNFARWVVSKVSGRRVSVAEGSRRGRKSKPKPMQSFQDEVVEDTDPGYDDDIPTPGNIPRIKKDAGLLFSKGSLEEAWPMPGARSTTGTARSIVQKPMKEFAQVRGKKVKLETIVANEISMTRYQCDARRDRIEIYGYKTDLARALASLFVSVFKAAGKVVSRKQIMHRFFVTDNDAYQRIWRLRKMLDKAYPGLGELIQFTDDRLGCYFVPLPPKGRKK